MAASYFHRFLKRCDGLIIGAFSPVIVTEPPMNTPEIWVQLGNVLVQFPGALELAPSHILLTQIHVRRQRQGIDVLGQLGLTDCLFLAPHRFQKKAVEQPGLCITGIELNRALKSLLRAGPILLILEADNAKEGMGLGKRSTQFYCFEHRFFCRRQCLAGFNQLEAVTTKKTMACDHARIGRRIFRILLDGLLKIIDAFSISLFGQLVAKVESL